MKIFDVFISYRREDGTAAARALYEYLTQKGLKVFFDTEAIVDGHRFDTQIKKCLYAATHYILIGSNKAMVHKEDEDWVHKEIRIAIRCYNANKENRTVTVLVPEGAAPDVKLLPKDIRGVMKFQNIFGTTEEAFERVLKVVTAVSHANLWHGAYRWLERSKLPGGRFAGVTVSDSLLPNIGEQLPILVDGQCAWHMPLLKAVAAASAHLYLIGQGGIGKTTALLQIMNSAYEGKKYRSKAPVPLFVELSSAPDTFGRLYQGGNSSFIRRAIYRQLRPDKSLKQISSAAVEALDEAFMLPYDTAVEPIDDLLSKERERPEFLLLLDGLNEVSTAVVEQTGRTVAEMVVEEIRYLLRDCSNVRLVLTSRSQELTLEHENIQSLQLIGLDPDTVCKYLQKKRIPDRQCKAIMADAGIMQMLRIPLFLIMYAELSDQKGICTQGQILHTFFSQRRSGSYTVQSRLDAVADSAKKAASAVSKNRIEPDMLCFLLDFILPQIAWEMEKQEKFYLPQRKLRELICHVLEDRDDYSVCGAFGREVFDRYGQVGSAADHTAAIAKKIISRLGEDMDTVCEQIISQCVFNLGILQKQERKYGFFHQHIRDYFAAVRYINTMQLAVYMYEEEEPELAYTCMEQVFSGKPMDMTVRRFVGEVLCEHQNTPQFDQQWQYAVPDQPGERRLITDTLNIYRGHFPGGQGIATLIRILKDVRRILAGTDLSRLDLTGCDLNDTGLCMGSVRAKLTGARLNGDSLIHNGHSSWINTVNYSADGQYILTGANDGKVVCHNALNAVRRELLFNFGAVRFAKLLENGDLLCICESSFRNDTYGICKQYRIELMAQNDTEMCQQITLSAEPEQIQLSADASLLLVKEPEQVVLVRVNTLQIIQKIQISREDLFAVFYGDSNNVVLSDGRMIDPLTGEESLLPVHDAHRIAFFGDSVCTLTVEEEIFKLELRTKHSHQITHTVLQGWQNRSKIHERALFRNQRRTLCMRYSDQGKWLAVLTPQQLFIYETTQYRLVKCIEGMDITDVDFCDRDSRMAAGTVDGHLYLYETICFTPVTYTEGIYRGITAFDASDDGKYLITISKDERLRLWDLETQTLLAQKKVPWDPSVFPEFSDDGRYLWFTWKNQRFIYSVPELEQVLQSNAVPHFSGEYMSLHEIKKVTVYKNGELQYGQMVFGVGSHMAGNHLFLQLEDRRWVAILLETGDPCWITEEPMHIICTDGRYLVAEQNMQTVLILDCKDGTVLSRMEKDRFGRMDYTLCGDYLLDRQWESTVIRKLPTLQQVTELPGLVTASDDGKWLVQESEKDFDILKLTVYRTKDMCQCENYSIPIDMPLLSGKNGGYFITGDGKICLRERPESINVYKLTAPAGAFFLPRQHLGTVTVEPGLDILGLELDKLHPGSHITQAQKVILHRYGAKL